MVLCLFGLLLLWGFSRRREKQGRLLVTAGISWMAFFGMDPVAEALMGPLEDPFRPVEPLLLKKVSRSSSLSSWLAVTERILSYQSQAIFRSPAIHRLIEGIRLHRKITKQIGPLRRYCFLWKRECETMKTLALELGVEEMDIILEGESRHTKPSCTTDSST